MGELSWWPRGLGCLVCTLSVVVVKPNTGSCSDCKLQPLAYGLKALSIGKATSIGLLCASDDVSPCCSIPRHFQTFRN